jgi:hypothetical protein
VEKILYYSTTGHEGCHDNTDTGIKLWLQRKDRVKFTIGFSHHIIKGLGSEGQATLLYFSAPDGDVWPVSRSYHFIPNQCVQWTLRKYVVKVRRG